MFLPSIKDNEIKLFLSRETRNGLPENQVTNRIAAEIPIRLNFDRNEARDFRALPEGGGRCAPSFALRRGFCGGPRQIELFDPNVCTPFGCKNYVAPADTSFLEFIDDETHISPRCRANLSTFF
jgi:hypothetical protein